MKIISLLTTPHGLRGNTAALLRYVIEGAKAEGAKTETVVSLICVEIFELFQQVVL